MGLETLHIKRDYSAFQHRLVLFSIAYSLLAFVSVFILQRTFRFFGATPLVSLLILCALAVALYGLFAWLLYKQWAAENYSIERDALIITTNVMVKKRSTVYRLESLMSARVEQSAKPYNKKRYGNIFIAIPRLEKELILRDVEDPEKALSLIHEHMRQKPASTNTLVT